jgi:hypothetical protein
MTRANSTFQRLVNSESIAALEAELKADEARFGELVDQYSRLHEQAVSLNESIRRQKTVIKGIRDAFPSGTSQPVLGDKSGHTGMSKREIAAQVLGSSFQPLLPREVREVAVEKGWLPDDRAAANQLSVAMAKAARAGAFVRDENGKYSLPGANDAANFDLGAGRG